MRLRSQKQLYFKLQSHSYSRQDELSEMSLILDNLPNYEEILIKVENDLSPNNKTGKAGRKGMTAEQVFRAFLLRSRFNYSYRNLADCTEDSLSARDFLKINPHAKGFKYKTLQTNIKLIKEETLDYIGDAIKIFAQKSGIEKGDEIRTDGFTTQSNIHYPSDWSLMHDSIRVLSRTLTRAFEEFGGCFKFTNHFRASKRKLFKVNNSRSKKKKEAWNKELIILCRKTIGYSKEALPALINCRVPGSYNSRLESYISELTEFIPLSEQVLDQAYRRIVLLESVPADEKLFSIFETHTDIMAKGLRDVTFGHKNTITTGKSGLILDVDIHTGNPADSTLVKGVLENHKKFYNKAPQKSVFDGCYSSKANRELALSEGVRDVCFSKETDQESSCTRAVRRKLRNFRAGIEATVSMLKRMFGLTRVMDKGFTSFKKAVKAATITYNLFILSRHSLQT